MRNLILPLVLLSLIISTSCQKKSDLSGTGTDSTSSATRLELLKDSVYLYTKEVYLWNNLLPTYTQFNPRQFTGATELASATGIMNAVRALQPLDRFSFVTSTAAASGLQTGVDVDLGFLVKPAAVDRAYPIDSVYWFVNYVYTSSPAGQAGIQRGMRLTKIGNTNLEYTDASVSLLNNTFFGTTTSSSFQFTKSDGTTLGPITLTKASYVANSVLYRNVFVSGTKKVGYLVFNQFFAEPSRRELGDAFTYFSSQGVNDLVVDLRYNGGGVTGTQDTLANLIAPATANNKTMYQYVYNETLQQNQHQLIKKSLGYGNIFTAAANTQVFRKAGGLNLNRVFFIVSGSTASASELLINNLKPYMNVQLIGDTTYGKPVGFFAIPIYDYAIFPISFKTVNSAGNADYYSGFAPNAVATDNVTMNWGDPAEESLAAALKFINTGSYRVSATSDAVRDLQFRASQEVEPVNKQFGNNRFVGMFREPGR